MAKFLDKAGLERFWEKVKAYVDSRIVGGGSGGEVYSTEEIRIGTWIDGKPIYRKIYEATSASVLNTVTPIVNNVLNVDTVVSISGILNFQSASVFIQIPDSYNDLSYNYSSYSICHTSRSKSYYGHPITVLFEYTKTTDQATISIPAAALSLQETLDEMRETVLEETPD